MGLSSIVLVVGCFIYMVGAPPVTQKEESKDNFEANLEYHRYFKEIIEVLDTDKEFRDKLMNVDEKDIQTGKIAHELDFVNHNVRTKLDEIKRRELERLRHLATKQFELMNDIDTSNLKIGHIDHNNPHTFEIQDLKKLLVSAMEDINKADKQRKEEFKEYEMQKEFDKQQKLQSLDEEHRKEFEKEIHDKEEKHKKHEPLHHPMSRQQIEEVWEKQDHMDKQALDLRSFFMMHDVDGNGFWDEVEVKALFLKELDKMYQNGAPEDDMWERREEMERMREHVFRETDRDRDGLISYEEFLIQTRREEFERDKGWKSLDEQQVYSPEEYHEFEKRRLEEMQRMIDQGLLPPPHPGQYPPGQYPPQYHPNAIPQPGHYPPNYNQQQHPQQGQVPQQNQHYQEQQPQHYQQYQGQQQGHPQQVQQGHPQQVQQQQGHPQQVQQGHPQQVQQGHPQQVQQQQGHPQQVQQQGHPQQVQQGHPQQVQQGHPQQVQQQQGHPQQVQQGHPQQGQQGHPQQVQQQGHPQQQAQPQQQSHPQQGQPQQGQQGQVQHPPTDSKEPQVHS